MSKINLQTNLYSKEHAKEEIPEKIVSNTVKISKEEVFPPKHASSDNFKAHQIKKGKAPIQNKEIHSEKFNGPLEKAKTANKAFGSISDFLLFFENRNPEIKHFAKRFQEMEEVLKRAFSESLKILKEDIVPVLFRSFKIMPVEYKNHESSELNNKNKEDEQPKENLKKALKKFFQKKRIQKERKARNDYAQLFEKDFQNLEEFYKQILHAYTVPGFLYLRMNEYLRTEDWMKLDDLLLYTYCLFKAYQWGPTGLTDANIFAYLESKTENGILTLYRRADFDQKSIDFYHLDKVREFSWSGVTSTSLIESATRSFAGKNINKTAVLITIEVDFSDLQPEHFHALYLAKLSRCPAEEEVALAPGSIFELLAINKEKSEVEMKLKLVTNVKILAHQGKFLHGMLQALMRNEKELKIISLNQKELSRAIKHCKGNLLIENLEFTLCDFNQNASEILLEVLPTLKNLTSFVLNTVLFNASPFILGKLLKCLGELKIKQLEMIASLQEVEQVDSLIKGMKHLGSLCKIKLIFDQRFMVHGTLIETLYNSRLHYLGLQYLSPQCLVKFKTQDNLSFCSKQGMEYNFKKHIESLLMDSQHSRDHTGSTFENTTNVSRQKVDSGLIEEEIRNLFFASGEKFSSFGDSIILIFSNLAFFQNGFKSHRTSNDNLEAHSEIADQCFGLLQRICWFNSLHLNFEICHQINRNLKFLHHFLHHLHELVSLKTLHLNFKACHQTTDQSLEFLQNNYDSNPLSTLYLNFKACHQMTDKGLELLKGIGRLNDLETLNLRFKACHQTTDQSLEFLQNIHELKSLFTLHLNFKACHQITDKGLEFLKEIGHFDRLSTLDLNFQACHQITDEGLEFLQNIHDLQILSTLNLNFEACHTITDQSLEFLQNIHELKSLSTLYLNFKACHQITDKGLEFLNGIGHLDDLSILHLNFEACSQITEMSFKFLQHSKCLKSLKTLHLTFEACNQITDQDFNVLFREGICHQKFLIEHQKFLTRFSLEKPHFLEYQSPFSEVQENVNLVLCDFRRAPNIQTNSLTRKPGELPVYFCFLEDLGNLEGMKTLYFKFWDGSEVTDLEIEKLGTQLIKHSQILTDLHLNFSDCIKVTDKGLRSLSQSIITHLKLLKNLRLNFKSCVGITYEGLHLFCNEVVQSLRLNSLFLYTPDTSIQEELEDKISKFDSLTSYAIISQNRILKRKTKGFILKRSRLNPKNEHNKIEDSRRFPNENTQAHIIYSRKATFSSEKKLFILEESLGNELEQNLTFKENQKFVRFTFLWCERIIEKLLKSFSLPRTPLLNSLLILDLSFQMCLDITDEEIKNLACQAINPLKELHTLKLSFEGCCFITDKGIKSLCCEGIWHLLSLKNLNLVFDRCRQITSEGLKQIFCKNTQSLELITSLYLSFCECYKITDQGLQSLYFEGIQHLKSLESLYLNFNWCRDLTDEGLMALCYQKTQNLKSLKSLDLNFDGCIDITDKGLEILSSQGIQKAQSLESLSLSFLACAKVTDQGLQGLFDQGTQSLKSLKTLNLNFEWCSQITDEEFQNFSSQLTQQRPDLLICQTSSSRKIRFSCLESPSSIELCDVSAPPDIKCVDRVFFSFSQTPFELKESLDDLLSNPEPAEIQKPMGSDYSNLKLEFSDIIDDDLCRINFDQERRFDNLEICHYIFDGCRKLTGEYEGFTNFCHQGIRHFKSLVELSLSFNECKEMTDEGVKTLFHEGIKHLKRLETLSLSFDGSNQLTDAGFQSVCREEISNLKSLKSLSLNISVRDGISDEGLVCFCCETIEKLDSLVSFQLIIKNGDRITDKGLKSLISESMSKLFKLENIQLSFPHNLKVSPTVHQAFQRIMAYFGFENNPNVVS